MSPAAIETDFARFRASLFSRSSRDAYRLVEDAVLVLRITASYVSSDLNEVSLIDLPPLFNLFSDLDLPCWPSNGTSNTTSLPPLKIPVPPFPLVLRDLCSTAG